MPMQRYTNAKMKAAPDQSATSMFLSLDDPFVYFVLRLIKVKYLNRAYGSGKEDAPQCDVPGFENSKMKLLRHVSFVDCPVIYISCLLRGANHRYCQNFFLASFSTNY